MLEMQAFLLEISEYVLIVAIVAAEGDVVRVDIIDEMGLCS
jgi:hypothetical protein